MTAPMTPSHAKRLCLVYVAMGGDERQTERGTLDYASLMEDLNAVVDAKSDREAAKAIWWWASWDRERSALSWARRFREAYRTGKLELWREKSNAD